MDDPSVSSVPIPDPRYWGSKFWFTMHTVAYFYPDYPTQDEMASAKNFYTALADLLPCPGCARHYTSLLRAHPVDHAIGSREGLIEWVNMMHNEVNRRLGKPIVPLEEYLMMNRHLNKPPLVTYEPILLGLIIAIFAIIAIRTRYHQSA